MRIRTEYSTNYAYGKLTNVFKRLIELEYKAMPISDRYSTFGWIEWDELCNKHEKRPMFGVELGVSNNAGDKRASISHVSFFATENIKRVNDLIAFATAQTGACLTYEHVNAIDDLVIIVDNRAKLELLNPAHVYIALSPSIPIGYYRKAKELGFRFIQSSDNVFVTAEDKEEYRVLMGRNAYSATYAQFIETPTEWNAGLASFVDRKDLQEASYNRIVAERRCTAVLNRPKLPKIDAPQTIREMCMDGMQRLNVPNQEPYTSRLEHELKVIAEKHFEDYFYIVAELMQWARGRMVVSPGRGSSAGSLVCYLLGITSVDPIKYNLLFERFLDPTRKDLPDIDMDFDDNLRPMVFAHLEQLYGKEHFGKICAVTRFRPKTIINTAGTQLRIPIWLCQKAAEELHQHGSFDDRARNTFAETFKFGEFSQKLLNEYPEISLVFNSEFHAKNFSVHAAGAVITDQDISNYVAIDSRNDTIMADKNTAERLGLLKLDLLGVSQLSVFARALELIGFPATNAFLETIPLDDEEAFAVINHNKYSGLFQMGNALIKLFKQFYVKNLEDIIAVTSLARPGPLMAGGAQRWVNRRMGIHAVEYAHPCLEPFLKTTFGELVYQEQLMQIASSVGGMSVEDVTSLRKAVAKSKGSEALRPFGDKFKQGAARVGFVGEAVDKFWDDLCGFGAYSFNRSHAVSYSLITYYCCWLKAFHPVEFAAATLDAETEPEKQIKLLRELHAEGIGYVPIDPAISGDRWTIKDDPEKGKILVGPLTSIKGIGPAKLAQIIEARQTGKELPPGLAKQLRDAITPIDSLTPVSAALARCIPDLKSVNIVTKPTPISQLDAGDRGTHVIIGLLVGLKKKDRNDAESLARRKGKRVSGNSLALNLTFRDDSGADILAIIDPADFGDAAPNIIERGGVDKAIYAVKGTIPDNFRMMSVKNIRFLCNVDDGLRQIENDWFGPQIKKEDYFSNVKEPVDEQAPASP